MKQYTKTFQVSKLFGMLDSRHIRVCDTIVDVIQRECRECGSPLGEYCGCMDNYEPVVFKRRTNVFVKAEDSDFVEELWEELKERLVLEGKTKNDFYALLPQASTAFSCGLEPKPTSAHSSKTPEPVRVPTPERIALDPGKRMRGIFDVNSSPRRIIFEFDPN